MATIAVLGDFSTKAEAFAYLRRHIVQLGHTAYLIDFSVRGQPGLAADVGREQLAARAGITVDGLARLSRGEALNAMARGATALLSEQAARGQIHGIIAIGGAADTSVATSVMRALPFGLPKLMASTVTSGDIRGYVQTADITMLHLPIDVVGLNKLSRRLIANAAGAICGMAGMPAQDNPACRGAVGITVFNLTHGCVAAAKAVLEEARYEVIVFYAGGTGGMAMETLIREGLLDAVLDVTTTELADELVGGVMSAGPDRLRAAGEMGLPQVVAPGALDMVNFGAPDTIPRRFEGRRFYWHAPDVTLMRTSPRENAELGRLVAERLNEARGPAAFILPQQGFSALSREGEPFQNRLADESFATALGAHLDPRIRCITVDANMNDPVTGETAARTLIELMARADSRVPAARLS